MKKQEYYRDIANAYLSVKKIGKYLDYTDKSLKILRSYESYKQDVLFKYMEKSWISRDFDFAIYWSSKFLENSPNKTSRSYLDAKELRFLSLMNNDKYEDCLTEICEILSNDKAKLSTKRLANYYSLYLENLTRSNIKPNEINNELYFLDEIDSIINSSISKNKDKRFYAHYIRLYNTRNFYKLKFENISENLPWILFRL